VAVALGRREGEAERRREGGQLTPWRRRKTRGGMASCRWRCSSCAALHWSEGRTSERRTRRIAESQPFLCSHRLVHCSRTTGQDAPSIGRPPANRCVLDSLPPVPPSLTSSPSSSSFLPTRRHSLHRGHEPAQGVPRLVPVAQVRRPVQHGKGRPQRLSPSRGAPALSLSRSRPARQRDPDPCSFRPQRLERTSKNAQLAKDKRKEIERRWKEIEQDS